VDISIADTTFCVSSRDLGLSSEPNRKTYLPFIESGTLSSDDGVIRVEIKGGEFPDTSEFVKIFDSHESWSMLKKGDEYLWIDLPASSGGPLCLARFDRWLEKVTIYYANEFITDVGGEKVLVNPLSYPVDQLLLMYALAERQGALIHASGIEMDGKGYLFPGKSGAGKSTISKIFASRGHDILSDDRIAVRKIHGKFRMYGTPWSGEAEIAENRSVPLRGIFFIFQSTKNVMKEMSPSEAAERLMPVTSIPWYDRGALSGILSVCEDLVLGVPAYELHFKPEIGVVELFEEFVAGQVS
jgi:hypothetical protein